MTTNAFQRLSERKPDELSIFAQDFRFHTAGYAAWLRIAPAKRPEWEKFRDALMANEGRKKVLGRPKNGHGDIPLGPLSEKGAKDYLQRMAAWKPEKVAA